MHRWLSLVLLIKLNSLLHARNCGEITDCKACTTHHAAPGEQMCSWCPLDRTCNELGSRDTNCRREESVIVAEHCRVRVVKGPVYDPVIAYNNMLLSGAAYSDTPQQCIDKHLSNSGIKVVNMVADSCSDLPLFHGEKCSAIVGVSARLRSILVSYRGTDFTSGTRQLIDELLSVLTTPKVHFPAGGHVQSYFSKAHDKLYGRVNATVSGLVTQHPSYTVTVTGHSLGAALASLSSAQLVYDKVVPATAMILYAYGMPRVGDKQYALAHDALVPASWRVVHARDIVSHLPTCNPVAGCAHSLDGPYHHGREVYYPADQMAVGSSFKLCSGDEDERCSDGAMVWKWCLPLIGDLDTCIRFHKYYFGVRVGKLCA